MRVKQYRKISKLTMAVLVGGVVSMLAVVIATRINLAPTMISPTVHAIDYSASAVAEPLEWPSYGQSAVAGAGFGVVATNGDKNPQPTASTAKLITLLAVLKKHPITDGEGADITFNQQDVDSYERYIAGNGSSTRVQNGLVWSQYQAFQAVLLASSNNVSDSLAIWAFGSLDEYRKFAQEMVLELGMKDTTIGLDASGYSDTTASTAHDMALLGLEAMNSPVIREITSQNQAELPVAGVIYNTNKLLLDHQEVKGLKTGFIYESGGVFVLGGEHQVEGHLIDIVTVVMGAPGSISDAARQAQIDAYSLFKSAKANFQWQMIVERGQVVGEYNIPWKKEPLEIKSSQEINGFVWTPDTPRAVVLAKPISSNEAQEGLGSIVVRLEGEIVKSPLETAGIFERAPLWWRLFGW